MSIGHLSTASRRFSVTGIELWALIDSSTTTATNRRLGDAVELYLGEAEARNALAGVLNDEPGWREILTIRHVATIELSPS